MTFIEQLMERLKAVQGDTHAQAAVAAEFCLLAGPETERDLVRAALDAAVVLHWFDAALLGKVLGIPEAGAARGFEVLKPLPFVERCRRAGQDYRNIHEATRLGWRKQLAAHMPKRFRSLSTQAAEQFAASNAPADRIEWIYHLLCADPGRGADELEKLNREWTDAAHPEDRYALSSALRELTQSALVEGRARAWALLSIAWTNSSRGDMAGLAEVADEVLRLAAAAGDEHALAEGHCLVGDVFQAQGKLAGAQRAFRESLAISRRLAEEDRSNAGWQRDLGVAHSRVGDVFQAQGKLAEAQAAFGADLAISQRLAEQDPSNAGWQRELAVAHSRVGDVFQAQHNLSEAQTAFGECLVISRRLAEQDPGNAGWQRGLAVAHSRVGDVFQAQGRLAEAQRAFGEYLAISRRLAEQDPSNADWQRELAAAHSKVGNVFQAQGELAQAQRAFDEDLAISRSLAEQDPSNAGWQADLAVTYTGIARLETMAARHQAALPPLEEASGIYAALAESAPGFAQWAKDKKRVDEQLAQCRRRIAEEAARGARAGQGGDGPGSGSDLGGMQA